MKRTVCDSASVVPDTSRPLINVPSPLYCHPLGKFKRLFVGSNAVPFLCFKDVVLGKNNSFGLMKDPCYSAAPGSRYVRVFRRLSAL